jgi:maleate isomerase
MNIEHRFGLLLPSVNSTQEPELASVLPRNVSLHAARLRFRSIDPATMASSVLELEAESRKLADAGVGVIVFGATAPTLWGGKGYDTELIARIEHASGKPASTAATAFIQAAQMMALDRVAVGAPWDTSMNEPMLRFMAAHGIEVVKTDVEGFVSGSELGRVDISRACALARRVDDPAAQAIFMPGGNWFTLSAVDQLERELGKPVIANNAVSLWAGLRKLGFKGSVNGCGRLLREYL